MSGIIRPIVLVFFVTNELAIRFGTYPTSSMIRFIRSLVADEIFSSLPFTTFETVAIETSAILDTSLIVGFNSKVQIIR